MPRKRRSEPRGALLRAAALALGAALLAGCGSSRPVADLAPGEPTGDAVRRLLTDADSSLAAGDADRAHESISHAVLLAPSDAAARTALGKWNLAARRYRDARVELERAAELDSSSAEPLYLLGVAYVQTGDRTLGERSLAKALARDPTHAGAREALTRSVGDRCESAGLPREYAELWGRTTISRAELGVLLAIELGAAPDRTGWNASSRRSSDTPEARGHWGEEFLRAAIGRGWITEYPDGSFRLEDPVTRAALALLLAEIAREPRGEAEPAAPEIPDMGARHYLLRAAEAAVRLGLPLRAGGRFEPWAAVTPLEARAGVRGLGRRIGATSLLPEEPDAKPVVK